MAASETSAALDRHQGRREAGLATVTVLAGPIGLALRAARRWAEGRGLGTVEVADPRPEAIAGAWADGLAAGRDLRRDAVARLARTRGDDPDDLLRRVGRMSRPELAAFLDSTLPGEDCEAESACRWVLERSAAGEGVAAPGLAERLGAALAGREGDGGAERAFAALATLVPPGGGPVLVAARGDVLAGASAWAEVAAQSLARLALAQPRWSAILAIEPDDLDDYLRHAPESRAKALIRAGVVAVRGPVGPPVGPEPRPPAFVDREEDDGARSAAERFLFEQLEAHPATAGLFALNARLDIPFGPRRSMEVDLVSADLALAIEVDGYYHFRDEDAYRRDRRKDVLLQGRGYLVIRVLAGDVVSRLEDVLAQILAAVASRRRDPSAPHRDDSP